MDLTPLQAPPMEPTAPAKHLDVGNFMYALFEALNKDQETESQAQITDAQSTIVAANIESNLYSYWTKQLQIIAADIGHDAPNSKDLALDQAHFQLYSSVAQANQSQQEGAVQADEGQTSGDAQNLQMKGQMAQGVLSILSALTSMLGRLTA